MRDRRILVTGASGRLGSAVARRLATDNEVVGFDLKATSGNHLRTTNLVGSITNPEAVAQAVAGVNAIVHCAAIPCETDPKHQVVETNVMGTFLLLEAAARERVDQFVYISSIHWFGIEEHGLPVRLPEFLPIDETHPSFAVNAYGCSKVIAEYWCEWYCRKFKRSAVAIRPPKIIENDRQPPVADVGPASEAMLYDYVGISDLVEAIAIALDYHPTNGFDKFVVHAEDQQSGTPTIELVERFFPGTPADHAKLTRNGEFSALFDCSRARAILGWQPQYKCYRPGKSSR